MAQRRMFSLDIVDSDAFLEMPDSSQNLYFHLGMRADDDGFISNPKKIARILGASEDDLKILIAKRFVLTFETGVVVIKHWKINNYIQSDRYKPTKYLDEKRLLETKENGSYTDRIQENNTMETQVRLGKVSIGKRERDAKASTSPSYLKNIPLEDIKYFREITKATDKQIKDKGEQLFDYCLAKGKTYKNYKALLANALRKDYPLKNDFDEKYLLSG